MLLVSVSALNNTVVFSELFGTEDKDYRRLPPIPKLQEGIEPPSPSSAGWASFKASRPEDFPFRQPRTSIDIPSSPLDVDLRSPPLMSPPLRPYSSDSSRSVLFNTPISPEQENISIPKPLLLNQADEILREAERQLQSGKLSHEQHQELLRQLDQLYKLQKLKQQLREHRNMSEEDRVKEEEAQKTYIERARQLRKLYDSRPDGLRLRMPGILAGVGRQPLRAPHPRASMLPPPPPPRHLMQVRHSPPEQPVWQMAPGELSLPYDMETYYVPEHDPRWWKPPTDGARVDHQLLLDNRFFGVPYNNQSRVIPIDSTHSLTVKADPTSKEIYIDNVCYYRVGDPVREFTYKGLKHKIAYYGQIKKLWIDGYMYEIQTDAPPVKVLLAGEEHDMRVDGIDDTVLIDGIIVAKYGEPKHFIQVGSRSHDIQFVPPARQILIDGKLCQLDLTHVFPSVIIEGKRHGIRFDGTAREIFLNGKAWTVNVDRPRKARFGGLRNHILALGGPGHEIIVDGKWYEVKFNGQEKSIQIGTHMESVRLEGPPPEVKILGEFVEDQQKIRELCQGHRIEPAMAVETSLKPILAAHTGRPTIRPPRPTAPPRLVGPPAPRQDALRMPVPDGPRPPRPSGHPSEPSFRPPRPTHSDQPPTTVPSLLGKLLDFCLLIKDCIALLFVMVT